MAEEVKAPVPEAEVPRAIAYLGENTQDLRNDVRDVRRLTAGSYEKFDVKIEELRKEMDADMYTDGDLAPALMDGVWLLRFHDDVSDEEGVQRTLYDLGWKGGPTPSATPCETESASSWRPWGTRPREDARTWAKDWPDT